MSKLKETEVKKKKREREVRESEGGREKLHIEIKFSTTRTE